jgi:hypothetical protein
MTGIAEFNYPAFEDACVRLRAEGYDVVSPHEVGAYDGWREYMKADIALLLTCDAVATLDGHENSKGAKLENHIARELDMKIKPVKEWLG